MPFNYNFITRLSLLGMTMWDFHVSSPLMKGCWLAASDGSRIWIDFRFKKLLDFCYICGCLDHNDRDYDKELEF